MNRRIYQQERRDWDNNATFYATEGTSPFKSILRQEMKSKFLISKKHRKILDLGAGVADFANDITQTYGNEVVCVDFSPEMKKAALKNFPKVKYLLASAEKLPFKDSSFDMVIAGGVLHHLKTQGIFKEGMEEIHRVLKKDGYFCYLDRSNSLIADLFEKFLSFIKRLYLIINKDHSASSTTAELSLDDNDFKLMHHQFSFVSRSSIYSMPFKFLMVTANFFFYIGGEKWYLNFQKIGYPLALFFEKYLNFRFWETEKCEVLKK